MAVGERREYPRINVDLPIVLRYRGRLIPATALNVSCGGMLLTTEVHDVTTNAPVEIIFDLSNMERDVTLRGEIVRIGASERSTVGVHFTNVYAIGHRTLERFLKRHKN